MGLVEWITGWEYIGSTLHQEKMKRVHPNIIKTLHKKAWSIIDQKCRGLSHGSTPEVIVYANGKTFRYKAKQTSGTFSETGGGTQGMKVWRKKISN